jgi:hypothetical protein
VELIATPKGFLSLAAVLAALLGAAPSAAAAIQLGAYVPGAPANAQRLHEYTAEVGRAPDVVSWYREFGKPLMEPAEIENLRGTGETPMVTWEPHNASLLDIASGAYDGYLDEAAAVAKSWEGPLLLRFAHEMNGSWYSWDAAAPETYVAAWRHVVSLFRADGAGNVKWVWSPYVLAGGKYPFASYFPGDEWIDYVGLDGYNWGPARGSWQSLEAVFAPSYALATEISAKPVIVAETGSTENGGDKGAWIRTGLMSALPRSFPRVVAVVWFDENREDDWRVDSSAGSLDAYRAVVACSFYGGTGPCEAGAEKRRLTVRDVRVPQTISGPVRGSISFALSEPAQVQVEVIPLRRSARTVSLLRESSAGRNRIPLRRILRRRHLHVGRYRVVISARNQNARASRRARFRVVGRASGRGRPRARVAVRLRPSRPRR